MEKAARLQAARLGKRHAPGQGGPHQISSGFKAAVTRRDQLKAKADGSVDRSLASLARALGSGGLAAAGRGLGQPGACSSAGRKVRGSQLAAA